MIATQIREIIPLRVVRRVCDEGECICQCVIYIGHTPLPCYAQSQGNEDHRQGKKNVTKHHSQTID